MNINAIKAALAAQASTMHIQPTNTAPAPASKAASLKVTGNTAATASNDKEPAPAKKTTRKASTKKAAHSSIDEIIAANLVADIDYNTIPGCGRKPSLLKPGAEKLASIFGYHSTSTVIHRIEDTEHRFFLYEIETTLTDKNGTIIATGLGSANSQERRYQRDFASSLNTVLKMAKKRSYVDAVLTATGASGTFTQDIEDLRELVSSSQPLSTSSRKEA